MSLQTKFEKPPSTQWLLDLVPLLSPFEQEVSSWQRLMIPSELANSLHLLQHYPWIVFLGMAFMRNLVALSGQTAIGMKGAQYNIQTPADDRGQWHAASKPRVVFKYMNTVDQFLDRAKYDTHSKVLPQWYSNGFFGPRRLAAAVDAAPIQNGAPGGAISSAAATAAADANTKRPDRIDCLALGYLQRDQLEQDKRDVDSLFEHLLHQGCQVDVLLLVLKHGLPQLSQPRAPAAADSSSSPSKVNNTGRFEGLVPFINDIKATIAAHATAGAATSTAMSQAKAKAAKIHDCLMHFTLTHNINTLPLWKYVLETCGALVFDPVDERHVTDVISTLVQAPRDLIDDMNIYRVVEYLINAHGCKDALEGLVHESPARKSAGGNALRKKVRPWWRESRLRSSLFALVIRAAPRSVIQVFLDQPTRRFTPEAICQQVYSEPGGSVCDLSCPNLAQEYSLVFKNLPRLLVGEEFQLESPQQGDYDIPGEAVGDEKDIDEQTKATAIRALTPISLLLLADRNTRPSSIRHLLEQCGQDPRSTLLFIHTLACDYAVMKHIVHWMLDDALARRGEDARRELEKLVNGTLLVAAGYLGRELVLNQIFNHYPGPNVRSLTQDLKANQVGFNGELGIDVAKRLGFHALRRNLQDRIEEEEEEEEDLE